MNNVVCPSGEKPPDPRDWNQFVKLYSPLLLRYVREQGLNEDDAPEVVQHILVTLLGKLSTFELDSEKGRFRTWLWQATRNAFVDWVRANRGTQGEPPREDSGNE